MPDIEDPTITGPIVACDNAITHYDKVLEQFTERIDKTAAELNRLRSERETIGHVRDQWIVARRILTNG